MEGFGDVIGMLEQVGVCMAIHMVFVPSDGYGRIWDHEKRW